MPDTKLSGLPSGLAIADENLFYSAQGGASVSQTALAFSDYIESKLGSSPTLLSLLAALQAALTPTQAVALVTTGTMQSDALALTADVNQVASVPDASSGAVLPLNTAFPKTVVVINQSTEANAFNLYPNSGADINGGTVDAPLVVASASAVTLVCYAGLHWVVSAVSTF